MGELPAEEIFPDCLGNVEEACETEDVNFSMPS